MALCKKYPIMFIDYESDTSFTYDDFFNETHLSEIGAEKFTRKLSNDIQNKNYRQAKRVL